MYNLTTNLMFGQLYFTGLQVNTDRLVALQLFSSPSEPCVQLIQRVLELTQTQQSTLQLMLQPQGISRKFFGEMGYYFQCVLFKSPISESL